MALLLNRNYSRPECMFYILKAAYANYGTKPFPMNGLKYDPAINNSHNHCQLLVNRLNTKYCPYLDNPLNKSFCDATQSIFSDTTKSKAISDIARSLEALGFILQNQNNKFTITEEGVSWVNSQFKSDKWHEHFRDGVLSYGLTIGLVFTAMQLASPFDASKIYLGYPDTNDPIKLSTGTTRDANTRTVSKIVNWCVAAGILQPYNNANESNDLPHIYYRSFINNKRLITRLFKITEYGKNVLQKKIYVNNPLSYLHLNKNVGSLRDRGIEDLRNKTIKYNYLILNRRYVFVTVLNYASANNKVVNLYKLVSKMVEYSEYFFLPDSNALEIMQSESDIAKIVGIPFKYDEDTLDLLPLTNVNQSVLNMEAPEHIISLAKKIYEEII